MKNENGSSPLTLSFRFSRFDDLRGGIFPSIIANSPLVSQITVKSNTSVRMTTTKQFH